MGRNGRGARIGIGLFAMLLAIAPAAWTQDRVEKKVNDEVQALEGQIQSDNLSGISLRIGGAGETKVPRPQVAGVDYTAAPGFVPAAKEAVAAENWEELQNALNQAHSDMRRNSEQPNLNLARQHFFYYAAVFYENTGDLQKALQNYQSISKVVENSALYFQAQLGIARMLEQGGNATQAADRFRIAVRDFKEKQQQFQLGDWADPYVALAEFGHLRMQVKAAGEDERKLEQLSGVLDKAVRSYQLSVEAKGAARRVKALIWRGQKEWEKLVDFLDDEIMEGELNDRRRKLAPQYLERADANYALERYRDAALDYLRLWFVYDIQPPQAPRVHLRLGECMVRMEPRENDWVKKAKKHFAFARSFDIEPWASEAKDALKRLRESQGEAAEGTEKDGESAE